MTLVSFWSRESELVLGRIGINRTFLSAEGIHRERGVTCSNFHEVPLKQAAMARAEERCLVADATPFGRAKLAWFADFAAFDRIVTDSSIPSFVNTNFAGLRPAPEIAGV